MDEMSRDRKEKSQQIFSLVLPKEDAPGDDISNDEQELSYRFLTFTSFSCPEKQGKTDIF